MYFRLLLLSRSHDQNSSSAAASAADSSAPAASAANTGNSGISSFEELKSSSAVSKLNPKNILPIVYSESNPHSTADAKDYTSKTICHAEACRFQFCLERNHNQQKLCQPDLEAFNKCKRIIEQRRADAGKSTAPASASVHNHRSYFSSAMHSVAEFLRIPHQMKG